MATSAMLKNSLLGRGDIDNDDLEGAGEVEQGSVQKKRGRPAKIMQRENDCDSLADAFDEFGE